MNRLIVAGLTGGIASGKSTAALMFARRGARLIDTDTLAHQALAPRTATGRRVVEAFGRGIVDPDGTINRARLGEIVFADERQRLRLNELVHPAVRQAWLEEIEALRRLGETGVVLVIIPLLYETGAQDLFDRVIAVACGVATQQARLSSRGLTAQQASARVAAQLPMTQKMERADYVIWSEGALPVLEQQVERVWQRLQTI